MRLILSLLLLVQTGQAANLDSITDLNFLKASYLVINSDEVFNREILIFPKFNHQPERMMVHAKLGQLEFTNNEDKSFHILHVDKNVDLNEALAHLNADPEIEWAQPNFKYYASTTTPTDTQFSQLWALNNTNQTVTTGLGSGVETVYGTNNPPGAAAVGKDISATKVWDYATDCSATKIGILDTGISYTNPELSGSMWQDSNDATFGYDFVNNDSNPTDDNGHGTFVASVIGSTGNNASRMAGICWDASLMAIKVADKTGTFTTARIIAGLNFGISKGAKVFLLAAAAASGSVDYALKDAISQAGTSGALVIVPSGNNTSDVSTGNIYPCKFDLSNMLCVAGVDQNFSLVTTSNYNSSIVKIAAPGANIRGVYPYIATSSSIDFSTFNAASDYYNAVTNVTGQWSQSGTTNLMTPRNWDGSTTQYGTNRYSFVYSTAANYSAFSTISASLNLSAASFSTNRDSFTMAYSTDGTNPFTADFSSRTLYSLQASTAAATQTIDMASCISATCIFGFLLQSDNTTTGGTEFGIRVNSLTLNFTTASSITDSIVTGTSVAAAYTAGVAALVWAKSPNMTLTQLRTSVLNGNNINTLNVSVESGRVLNAWGAYTFINTVTGLRATVYE
jgi:thermitase